MDITEAMLKLKDLEGGSELHAVVSLHLEGLNKEAAKYRRSLKDANTRIDGLNDLIGGDDKDAQKVLGEWQKKVDDLEKEKADLTKTIGDRDAQIATIEKDRVLDRAVSKSGADESAFKRLLSDVKADAIAIEDDKVFITDDGKKLALTEYAAKQGDWFTRALWKDGVPGQNQQQQQQGGQSQQQGGQNQQGQPAGDNRINITAGGDRDRQATGNNQQQAQPPQLPTGGSGNTGSGGQDTLSSIERARRARYSQVDRLRPQTKTGA